MAKSIINVVISLIILALGILVGWFARPKCPVIVDTRIDTIVRIDTIRDTVLIPQYRYITRIETDTLKIKGDTVFIEVEIPIERKVYVTNDYRAEIEGYKPSLVSMDIYRRIEYINTTQTVKVLDIKRWGIGPQIGYGAGLKNGRVQLYPYIGIGIQYNVVKW